MFDATFFIGRFQPFHRGHKAVIDVALEKSQYVIIGLGSSNRSRSIKNPFTAEEREQIIKAHYEKDKDRIFFVYLNDYVYDDTKWLAETRDRLSKAVDAIEIIQNCKINRRNMALIGHEKDDSSFYLKMFPELKSISVPNFENLDATWVRKMLFEQHKVVQVPIESIREIQKILSDPTNKVLEKLKVEWDMIEMYKKAWSAAPYPPTFVTTDAVVVCSGHILLIKRKAAPGAGLSALPGGFLDIPSKERLVDGMMRELREETKLKVPREVLLGSIVDRQVFDAPDRSLRGRTITHAFYIDLGMRDELPKVRGSDDAEKAFWLPINEINPRMMFEDHADIISHFTKI